MIIHIEREYNGLKSLENVHVIAIAMKLKHTLLYDDNDDVIRINIQSIFKVSNQCPRIHYQLSAILKFCVS